ncbi:MAG: sulfurtransferase TusA family protein [Nitrospirae bacterium]|nr:sulfurtransferase TusA family protein [Nitrospirota bacterium]
MEEIKVDETLDCFGLICPVPVHLTAKKIKQFQVGQVLVVIADDPDSLQDIPAWCKSSGHKLLRFEPEGNIYKFYIRKEAEQNK